MSYLVCIFFVSNIYFVYIFIIIKWCIFVFLLRMFLFIKFLEKIFLCISVLWWFLNNFLEV